MPTASVLIITYNHEDFIEECLESVLSQDFADYEVVVADDGSSDRTTEILKGYLSTFPEKFKLVLSTKNMGVTHNCNSGLKACAGDYVIFLGGDDTMLPNRIAKQTAFLDANPSAAVVYHDLDVFNSSTGRSMGRLIGDHGREGNIKTMIRHGCFNGGSGTAIRRAASPTHGFDTLLQVGSDWLFWIECLAGGGDILYQPELLGRYRKHPQSFTAQAPVGQGALNAAQLDVLFTHQILLNRFSEYRQDTLAHYTETLAQFIGFKAPLSLFLGLGSQAIWAAFKLGLLRLLTGLGLATVARQFRSSTKRRSQFQNP